MKKFVAIYLGTSDSLDKWAAKSPQEKQECQTTGIAAWRAWMEKNKQSLVEIGSPLGKTKSVSSSGISDTKNNITGFTVVEAETHEAAAKLFQNHPHFSVFPGKAIEVMECLPIPEAS